MAEGGEYQFHDISVGNINGDVFDDLSPLQRSSVLRNELLRDKLNSFYESVGKYPDVVDPNQFVLDKGNHLFVKTDKGEVQLTHKKDPRKFRQLNTLQVEMGIDGVRRYLSLSDAKIGPKSIQAFETAKDKLPSDRDIEMTELKRLPEVANTIVQDTSFSSLNEIDEIMQTDPLPLTKSMNSIKPFRPFTVN